MKKDLKEELLIKFYIWYLKFNKVEKDVNVPKKDFKDVYLFESDIEYFQLLKNNGIDINLYPKVLLESPIIRKFKNGNILAFKGIYDDLIRVTTSSSNELVEDNKQKIVKFRKR